MAGFAGNPQLLSHASRPIMRRGKLFVVCQVKFTGWTHTVVEPSVSRGCKSKRLI
jgi:hypothetical protein